MIKLFRNKEQVITCKVKVEGDNLSKTKIQLVLSDKEMKHVFEGKIDVLGNSLIEIPALINIKNMKGDAVIEVIVGKELFKPLKTTYEIIDKKVNISEIITKKVTKTGTFSLKATQEDKKIIKEMIKSFNSIGKKHKKFLREFVDGEYKPNQKTIKWATRIFNNISTIQAKMSMYEFENILQKRG